MIRVRHAAAGDRAAISGLIGRLELSYPSQSFDDFWVAEDDQAIRGIADLKEFPEFFFLSSVGVAEPDQHRGVATTLLKAILNGRPKDVYLYTTVPGFFSRLGFEITTARPFRLPPKETFNCRECTPETCVTMVKKAGPA